MVMTQASGKGYRNRLTFTALLLAALSLLLAVFAVPAASAQSTENSTIRTQLASAKFYVSNGVKQQLQSNADFGNRNQNLESNIQNVVNKYAGRGDVRIAVIDTALLNANGGNLERFANTLYSEALSAKPVALILINGQSRDIFIVSNKLSDSEVREIVNGPARQAFVSNNNSITPAADAAAKGVVDKISSNSATGTIITVVVIAIVIALIVGIVFAVYTSTKKRWATQIANLQQIAAQVSDKVVNLSTEVELLPENVRSRGQKDFGEATSNYSEANERLRELEGVKPTTLLLKGADYNRKLNMTTAQFEQLRQSLTRLEQNVNRTLPGN